MTDREIRAELERIDPIYPDSFTHGSLHLKELYCLLAEQHKALREIREDPIGGSVSHCPYCIRKRDIAKTAIKEE